MKKLVILILFCLQAAAQPLKIDVSAKSAILINADSGAILFEKDAHRPSFPASITKVATALYVLERKGNMLHEVITASNDCLATVPDDPIHPPHLPPYILKTGGTHMGLRVGESLDLRTLMYGLLLSSGNDAANVIAKYVSGDIGKFMEELGLYLQSKGLNESSFVNPHGLHHPAHRTTAHDMAFIAKEALKYPFFREVVKTIRYIRPQTNKQAQNFLVQGNRLVKPGQYYYPKALGIKTGYHSQGGCTLVAAASHEGRELVAVVLGCPDASARYRDTIKLFETAFAEQPVSRTLFTQQHDRFSCQIKGAKRPLEAQLKEDLVLSYYPAEEPDFKAQVKWESTSLPISKGQVVGKLQLVTDKGKVLRSDPLLAAYDVDRNLWKTFADFCSRHRTFLLLTFLGLNVLAGLFYFFKKSQKVA